MARAVPAHATAKEQRCYSVAACQKGDRHEHSECVPGPFGFHGCQSNPDTTDFCYDYYPVDPPEVVMVETCTCR